MTTEAFFRSINRWREMLMLGGLLAGVISFGVTFIFAGVMYLWGPSLQTWAQSWLGVTEIKEQIAEISGTNRVTVQPDGMSYVREPVILGQPLTLVLHIGRTEVGAACILTEVIPLFTDDFGTTIAGERRNPSQQLGPQVVRRELTLPMPATLRPGHATLMLQLEYNCGGVTVFETTHPVQFFVEEA
jgi:hypothetical protein